jgi:hypothetical protein
VELVGDRLPLCTTSVEHAGPTGGGGLSSPSSAARGRDGCVYESEMPDVVGGELRVCMEAWITGMWVLVLREEALVALNADYVRRGNLLIERAGLDVQLLDPVEEESALPSIEARFQAVEDRLVPKMMAMRARSSGPISWSTEPSRARVSMPDSRCAT